MFNNLNPQFPYYLMLFILTFVLRFIRAYKSHPEEKNTQEAKDYWSHYLYFGFELVNVSAGVFILLSEKASSFVGSFMMFYVILVVISFFLEDEKTGRGLKLWGNIVVSLAVIGITWYAFINIDGLKATNKIPSAKWTVALPYIDTSLNRNFAPKNEPIKNIYIKKIEASSRLEAISLVKQDFYSKGPNPFVPKTEKSPITMIVLDAEAVVEANEK